MHRNRHKQREKKILKTLHKALESFVVNGQKKNDNNRNYETENIAGYQGENEIDELKNKKKNQYDSRPFQILFAPTSNDSH